MKLSRVIRYNFLRLIRLKSDPKEVALGLSLGFIPNWFPTFGLGPIMSVALGKMFKTNLLSAFIGGVSGSILWPFLFYLNYKIGHLLMRIGGNISNINPRHVGSINLFYYKTKMIGFGFLVGSVINTILSSIIIYFISLILFKKYQPIISEKIRNRNLNKMK